MQGKRINMMDQRFDRWLVVDSAPNNKANQAMWLCRCDCGTEKVMHGSALRARKTKSCGCFHVENCRKRMTRHGLSGTLEHGVWLMMRDRCRNPRNAKYESYGGRGISVCERWDSFENFIADIGPKPTPAHSIDRIDNDGNYEPSNCRWATKFEQTHNRRPNRRPSPTAEKAPA